MKKPTNTKRSNSEKNTGAARHGRDPRQGSDRKIGASTGAHPPQPTIAPEQWMIEAANDIDRKLGLPRFDSAIADAAGIIAFNYAAAEHRRVTSMTRKKGLSGTR